MPHCRPVLIVLVLLGLGLAGCGGQSTTTRASATTSRPAPPTTSRPAPPTATVVGSGTPPQSGSTATTGKAATPIATGHHDHPGELCSGRDEARFAGEGLICVTGRLAKRHR